MASGAFVDGTVRYPDDLPCPHADTDLTPRERRYVSDIGEVKKLRRFQKAFQATRQNISFVFTPEQSKRFREWYKNNIIEGGAWFYADWPILHKEKNIAYRFVTRPVWEFLARRNYHVSATVEIYERKVGKVSNLYTSKIYPYYFNDAISLDGASVKGMPFAKMTDAIQPLGAKVVSGVLVKRIYSQYDFLDRITFSGAYISSAQITRRIYSQYDLEDAIALRGVTITDGEIPYRLISYDYFDDRITFNGASIISGEKQ